MWDETTKSGVVRVDVWLQELGKRAWLWVRRWHVWEALLRISSLTSWALRMWVLTDVDGWVWAEGLLLRLERLRKVIEKWVQGAVHCEMEQDGADEANDGDDQRTDGDGDSEETNHADLCKVNTSRQVLEGTWVDETLSVNLGVGDEKDVVAVCKIEEENTDGCESEDERCNHRVGNSCSGVRI